MYANKMNMRKLCWSVSLLFSMSGLAWAGDVTVYEKAPSVEELQQKLTGGGEGKKKMRTRSIVFGDAAAPAAEAAAPVAAVEAPPAPQQPAMAAQPATVAPLPAAPAPVAQPQAAPMPTTYAPSGTVAGFAASPKVPAPQAMQVSDNAIAFPINFRVNSSEILPESTPFLDSIAGLMQKDSSIRLLIEGHTDSSGNPARNTALSRERAYSVMNYLIDRYRVDPMRLVPVGKGFSEPLGGMEPTNPKNRRVQFRIIG